jgi:hypothetical protein
MFGLIIGGVPHVHVTWNWQHEAHVGSFAHVAMPIPSSPRLCEPVEKNQGKFLSFLIEQKHFLMTR